MYRVLIAEDEMLIRAGIQACVPWASLDMRLVASCVDGLSAWRLFEREKPDIVITDIRMPGLDGISLIRRIREVDSRCRAIIITCVEDFPPEIFDLDVTDYLLKASMGAEEMLLSLAKARDALDMRRPEPSANARSDLRALFLAYVARRSISAEEFERGSVAMQTGGGECGALATVRVPGAAAEQTRAAVRGMLEKRLMLLGDCLLMDADGDLLICASRAVEPSMMRSCFEGVRRCLADTLGLSAQMCAHLQPIPIRDLPDAFARCRSVLSAVYFYPNDFYDLSGPEPTKPRAECVGIARILEHPACQGILAGGGRRVAALCAEMRQAFGEDRDRFLRALTRLSDYLAPYLALPPSLNEKIAVAASANAALAALADAMPACERHGSYAQRLKQIVDFLNANFSERTVKLSDLADQGHFSAGHFARLFKGFTGMSFTDYLSMLRMEKARRLLEETDLSVHQVSEQCGFSAVSYFTRYFTQNSRCSPKEWRKLHCAS